MKCVNKPYSSVAYCRAGEHIIVNTDGGSRGLERHGAIGGIISRRVGSNLTMVSEISEYLGTDIDSNEAEYHAIIHALRTCQQFKGSNGVLVLHVYTDSQVFFFYIHLGRVIRSKRLMDLYKKIWELTLLFECVYFYKVKSQNNRYADRLVKKAYKIQFNGNLLELGKPKKR